MLDPQNMGKEPNKMVLSFFVQFYSQLKYGEIGLQIQEYAKFDISAIAFDPYVLERFGFCQCVPRPPKPRYRAQNDCSTMYG